MPWVLQEARALPALALPAACPVCLKATGLLPLALVGVGEDTQARRLLYRLYGTYLAVLSARCEAEEAAKLGRDVACTVFGTSRGRGPDSRQGKGREQLADGLLSPSAGPPAAAAGPAGGMAVGGRLCGGPCALGLGAIVGTRLWPGHLRQAGP